MKFFIKKIILWSLNGKKRELEFKNNKVNVITGDSNTGKTAILDIIDYCFFSSEPKISDGLINENILWYGLVLKINDKEYTISRKRIENRSPSKEYYFSSIGDEPNELESNISEVALKALLETEFSIDKNVAIPYGSNIISPGSKISLRYFMMFNTISGNIIENDLGVYFDKQNNARYRDALPRIFDLAVGIETVENVLKKEKLAEFEKTLKKLERKESKFSKKEDDFKKEKADIIIKAKEFSLINDDLDIDESIDCLRSLLNESFESHTIQTSRANLEKDFFLIQRKIKNIKRFSSEYEAYKRNISNTEDSLKPIDFLKNKDSELVKTSIFDDLVKSYSSDLLKIKKARKKRTPIDNQMNDVIKGLELELNKINEILSIYPDKNKSFDDQRSKYLFLGEIKAKIDLYSSSDNEFIKSNNEDIRLIKEKISLIDIKDTTEKKELTIKLIEEIINDYIELANGALENYAKYKPVFDYKNKSLLLRKPKTALIENVGSSSNHMFLHLFFSLAMQEVAFKNSSPFIAPFLIIDQPSRPYYGDSEERKSAINHSDEYKITKAFKLLDNYISERTYAGGDFQMIVFEHIPPKVFKDMKNIHLVEEFTGGNALIPLSLIR